MRILFTGLPGSGKTTQAIKISGYLNYCYVGVGDVLRDYADKLKDSDPSIKNTIDSGQMVDDKLVADLMRKELERPECQNGAVADGYPRHFGQINLFDPNYDKVFYLKISPEISKKRLIERGRVNEVISVIDYRINLEKEFIDDMLAFYRQTTTLVVIDGEKEVDEVFNQIKEHLNVT